MLSKRRLITIILTLAGVGLFLYAFLHLDPKKVM